MNVHISSRAAVQFIEMLSKSRHGQLKCNKSNTNSWSCNYLMRVKCVNVLQYCRDALSFLHFLVLHKYTDTNYIQARYTSGNQLFLTYMAICAYFSSLAALFCWKYIDIRYSDPQISVICIVLYCIVLLHTLGIATSSFRHTHCVCVYVTNKLLEC